MNHDEQEKLDYIMQPMKDRAKRHQADGALSESVSESQESDASALSKEEVLLGPMQRLAEKKGRGVHPEERRKPEAEAVPERTKEDVLLANMKAQPVAESLQNQKNADQRTKEDVLLTPMKNYKKAKERHAEKEMLQNLPERTKEDVILAPMKAQNSGPVPTEPGEMNEIKPGKLDVPLFNRSFWRVLLEGILIACAGILVITILTFTGVIKHWKLYDALILAAVVPFYTGFSVAGYTRRLLESVGASLISTIPIYILIKVGILKGGATYYFTMFSLSAFIFLAIQFLSLFRHLNRTRSLKAYFLSNGLIWIWMTCVSLIGLVAFSPEFYTALFGYTKPFRVFNIPSLWAAMIVWGLLLLEIVLFPLDRAQQEKQFGIEKGRK